MHTATATTAPQSRISISKAAKRLGLPIAAAYDLLWEAEARFSRYDGQQMVALADVDALASVL